ncbi:MAG: hypothetical protein QT11_C0001G1006 [archaeon GW2011_AR20]|nr:MAG: hypothetical protein QT11_C0001G1006 [archaeon GW2011_AR20]AQS33436.1 hypothetical protein [uncultured archaeon]AQS33500.1 hypothetical protein [uncultured archaeon]MBS3161024.1 hypothetical protein [Candidatus Woesearchaeota archaeon]
MKIKASSINSQIWVPLTIEETIELGRKGKLEGKLIVNDRKLNKSHTNESEHAILFVLNFSNLNNRNIDYSLKPNGSLQNAESLELNLYLPHYKRLLKKKIYTANVPELGILTLYRLEKDKF